VVDLANKQFFFTSFTVVTIICIIPYRLSIYQFVSIMIFIVVFFTLKTATIIFFFIIPHRLFLIIGSTHKFFFISIIFSMKKRIHTVFKEKKGYI